MPERFNQKVNLQTQNLSGGEAEGLMSLSGKFQQIAQENIAKREKTIIEESTLAGQQSFAKGEEPEFMTENKFIGGVTAKAYNTGLRSAYTASISNDVREDLAAIERENPTDIAAFKSKTAAHRAALVNDVDPVALPEILARFDQHTTTGSIRVKSAGEAKNRKQAVATLNANIASLGDEAARDARLGDSPAAKGNLVELSVTLDRAVSSNMMTREAANETLKKYQHEAIEQENRLKFDVISDEQGFEVAFKELDNIAGSPPKGWTPDEWSTYTASQQAELNRKINRMSAKTKEDKVAIKKQADYADIEEARRGNDRPVLNPKAVNSYYNDVLLPSLDGATSIQKEASIAEYVSKTKILPSTLKAQTSSFFRSGNPELIAEAAALVDRLDGVAGVADSMASPTERAMSAITVDLMANMDSQEAVTLAMKATDPKDRDRIEAVDIAIKAIKDKPSLYRETAKDIFNTFWSSDAVIDDINGATMGKEYGAQFEAYRKAGMDDTQANDATKGVIQRNWSKYEGRVMKYAPDQYYTPADGDSRYIMNQLHADVNQGFEGVNRENIILVSDPTTSRLATEGVPTYMVKIVLPNGELFTMPQRWAPDMQVELETRASETATEQLERRKNHMTTELKIQESLSNMRGF
tara:strand:+ start:4827 stop:6749 length:1923 start_codon:yes stop_codon:yes gene_type:complete